MTAMTAVSPWYVEWCFRFFETVTNDASYDSNETDVEVELLLVTAKLLSPYPA
jgi:hypothetical protein